MPICAKCRIEVSKFAIINTPINSSGDTVKLCPKCHMEWAQIENDFTKRKDEEIKSWLNS